MSLTCNTDGNFETVFTTAIWCNTTIRSRVRQTNRLENQRVDTILVDNNLVRSVIEDLLAILIPANLRVRSSYDYAVQSRRLTLGHFQVCWHFVEDRLDEYFCCDASDVVIRWTVSLAGPPVITEEQTAFQWQEIWMYNVQTNNNSILIISIAKKDRNKKKK